MFLNGLYRMRKVPKDHDGRTDDDKRQDTYRQYRTLYHEFDYREMYDYAFALWDRGFDNIDCGVH